jgi:hypothetical protein
MRVMSARLRSIAFALTAAITVAPSLAASGQESGVLTGQDLLFGGYYSAEWQSRDDIVAMVDATGKKVTFSGTFHNAAQEPAWITDWILEQSWEAESTPFANVNVPASARAVAAGLYDEDIERWVSQVKAWLDRGEGRSLFVAPFQEMNGTWTPYGGDPANFKIAYRKVVDAFRNAGIDETQVRFVFAPNSFSTRPYRIAHYYPGGTLVDVVGMSAYNMGPTLDRWISVRETMDAGLAELRQVAPRKPIIIAQVGSSPIEGDQVSWLWEMFTFLTRDPHVIGFVYFNFNKETDWRVWTGISLSDGWRIGMNLPTTLHVWPLTDWFRPGPLPFTVDGSAPSGWFIDDDDSEFAADIAWLVERRITPRLRRSGRRPLLPGGSGEPSPDGVVPRTGVRPPARRRRPVHRRLHLDASRRHQPDRPGGYQHGMRRQPVLSRRHRRPRPNGCVPGAGTRSPPDVGRFLHR